MSRLYEGHLKAKRVALCLEAEGRHFEDLLWFVNTIGAPHLQPRGHT
jgi:hypothetical protein